MDSVIIHYAEIALKGKNRPFFEKKLVSNIPLKNIKREYGRLVIELNKKDNLEDIKSKLKKVFGISHFSFCLKSELDLEDIKNKSLEILKDKKFSNFNVQAKRSNKNFKYSSMDLNKEIGAFIVQKLNKKVKLKDSDITLFIEIGEKSAYIFTEKIPGLGGLPVGVSGKLITLISGGLDSPVASFKMMKRGSRVIFIHFHNFSKVKDAVRDKVHKLVTKLSEYQGSSKLYLINFDEIQKELIKKIPSKYRMIIYRRIMFLIAEKILAKEKALGFVTGDSLGQVASQTLENLNAIYESANFNVFSPLIGMDKIEIINLAKELGTYEISILPYPDCCSFLVAEHPETKAKLEDIKKIEKNLDLDEIVKGGLKSLELVKIYPT